MEGSYIKVDGTIFLFCNSCISLKILEEQSFGKTLKAKICNKNACSLIFRIFVSSEKIKYIKHIK